MYRISSNRRQGRLFFRKVARRDVYLRPGAYFFVIMRSVEIEFEIMRSVLDFLWHRYMCKMIFRYRNDVSTEWVQSAPSIFSISGKLFGKQHSIVTFETLTLTFNARRLFYTRRLLFHERSRGGVYFRPAFILVPAFTLGNMVKQICSNLTPRA